MYQKRARWTAVQKNFLFENCYTMRDEDIANHLGKSLKSVRRYRERYELKKASGRGIVAKMPTKVNTEESKDSSENLPTV